jgi:trehalose 6-phosphate phosphatase
MTTALQSPTLLSPLLAAERLGLFCDCDGTISAIAVRPEAAVVSPAARQALATLAERLPVVVAISGRALFDLRALIDLPELLYIGSHGLAWWYRGVDEVADDVLPYVAYAEQAAAELATLRDIPGIRFEEKGAGLALHYRLAPDPDTARATIVAAIYASPAAQRFELRPGIQVLELYPHVSVNKGTALLRVVERFNLDGVIYFGDDLTDLDAIRTAVSLRDAGRIRAATIAVRHAEAPPAVADAADYIVDGVAGTEQVLEWLAAEVENRQERPEGT